MPEIWVPYGKVETLVTIQAENLGEIVQPQEEKSSADLERLVELVKGARSFFVCDPLPTTLEIVKELAQAVSSDGRAVYASAPKGLETAVPELKGRVTTLAPPLRTDDKSAPSYAQPLLDTGRKVFVGTARPDPLYGLIDPKVSACLNWVAGTQRVAAGERSEYEPAPYEKTDSYDSIEEAVAKISEGVFLTVVPRGGRVRSVLEDAPFDAIKNGFLSASLSPTKALVCGTGGSGYDSTFSGALRSVWNTIGGLRKGGLVLLVSECAEGLGSTALEMFATGRIQGDSKRKGAYVDGLEEVFYVAKLKEEYDLLLLSGLPDTYARSRLGLTTARGAGEAVGKLLNKAGRSAKVNVVTRAPECRVASA